MKNSLKFALSIGLTAIVTISGTLAFVTNYNDNRSYDSSNHNETTIVIDGKIFSVTPEKFEEEIRNNERLFTENKTLKDENEILMSENENLKEGMETLQSELDQIKERESQESGKAQGEDVNVGKDDNSDSEVPPIIGTDLTDITISEGFFVEKVELFEGPDNEMYGLAFEFISGNDSYITYDLGNNYSTFTAALMTPKEPPEAAKIAIGIYLDDKFIQNYELTYKDRIQKIGPIDVSGASKMTIRSKDLNNFKSGLCYVVNGSLQ